MHLIYTFLPCALLGFTQAQPIDRDCVPTFMTAFQSTNGSVPISTSPTAPINGVKIPTLNSTAFESWFWDGVSLNGDAGLSITLTRGASLASLGYGNLFVDFTAVFPNRTTVDYLEFFAESTIEECNGETYGLFSTDSTFISFHIAKSQDVVLVYNTSSVQGTVTLSPLTPPKNSDGTIYPDPKGVLAFCPLVWWQESVPGGLVHADLVFEGTPFVISGYGGAEHAWAAYSWEEVSESTLFFRAHVGPYILSYMGIESIISGLEGFYTDAFLIEQGTEVPIFATGNYSLTESNQLEYFLEYTYDGALHGPFNDTSTGYTLTMVDKTANQTWKFDIEHHLLEMDQAWERSGSGESTFVDLATGGLVGGIVYTGVAFTEANHY